LPFVDGAGPGRLVRRDFRTPVHPSVERDQGAPSAVLSDPPVEADEVTGPTHSSEFSIDDGLARRLVDAQFPEWRTLPLRRVEPVGTEHAIFRLGHELSVRLPRRNGPTEPGGPEWDWLAALASRLPIDIPVPVAQGCATDDYPGSGGSTRGSGWSGTDGSAA